MFVPNLDQYISESTISRCDILNKMLEHKNPAFIFMSILHRLDYDKFNESINYVRNYGHFMDLPFVILNEGDESSKSYGKGGKIANSTGVDSLKKLVGITGKDTELSDSQWMEVGRKISEMEGYNKRDYVGMMNFLNTSCFMHSKIMNHLSNNLRKNVKDRARAYQVPKTIKTKGRPKKKVEDAPEEEIKTSKVDIESQDDIQPQSQPQSQDDAQKQKQLISDGMVYNFDQFSKILENRKKVEELSDITHFDDVIKLMSYSLSQLTDLEVSDINDEIDDYNDDELSGYENEDGTVFLPYIELYDSYGNPLTESYTKDQKKNIRFTRGGGKGGLKGLVGKDAGDDLEDSDLISIANRVKNMSDDERGRYMGYIAFLGSSCPIFNYIRRGYLANIKDDTKTKFKQKQRRR